MGQKRIKINVDDCCAVDLFGVSKENVVAHLLNCALAGISDQELISIVDREIFDGVFPCRDDEGICSASSLEIVVAYAAFEGVVAESATEGGIA